MPRFALKQRAEKLYVKHGCFMYSIHGYIFVYPLFIIGNGIIPNNCEHGAIRFVGGTKDYEGNVEVCINGVWSVICDIGWSNTDAVVACSQAGYPGPG